MTYYSLEPFGEERADWRCAQTTAAVLNSNPNRDYKKYPPHSIDEFVFKYQEPKSEREIAELSRLDYLERKEHLMSIGRVRARREARAKAENQNVN